MTVTLEDKIPGLWAQYENGEVDAVYDQLGGDPDNLPLVGRTLLGLCCFRRGDFQRSSGLFEEVLEKEPQNPVAHLYLVIAAFRQGDLVKASDSFDTLPVLHPHSVFLKDFIEVFWPLRFSTSLIQYPLLPGKEGKGGEVQVDPFEKLFAVQKDLVAEGQGGKEAAQLADKYFNRALYFYNKGDRSSARQCFERCYLLDPTSVAVAASHGYLELLFGDGNKAHQALAPLMEQQIQDYQDNRTAEKLPSMDLMVSYAWSLHELGYHREALMVLSLGFPEGPEDSGAFFVSAVCWLMVGNHGAFEEAFSRAINSYFIDTWEQILEPFLMAVGRWLKDESTVLN